MAVTTDTTPLVISSHSIYGRGLLGPAVGIAPGYSSGTWPTASKIIYIPLVIPWSYACQRIFWCNGGAVSGNVDAGIYTQAGVLVGHTGSTVQAATNAVQSAAFNFTLAAGSYYFALVLDNTTGAMLRTSAINTTLMRMAGTLEQAATFPLTTPATFSTPASSYIPVMGITRASTFL